MRTLPLILLCTICLGLNAQKVPEAPVSSANIILNASQYAENKKYDKAIAELGKVNKNDSGYPLALAEMAYYYLVNEQHKEVIQVCDEGITLRSQYDFSFLNLRGKAYLNLSKYNEALQSFDACLKRYPMKFILYHNKALALYGLEKWDEAAENLKISIDKNPFWAESHYLLGKIMGEQGRLVPCMLAWSMYLLIEPAGKHSKDVITTMEQMCGGEYDYDKSRLVSENSIKEDKFSEIDELIRSKVALVKGYKSRTKLNFTITKQTQLLFEKLRYDAGDQGFFMQHYVPFYTEMFKRKHDVAFYHFTLVIMNIESVNKWLNKNQTKITLMAKWAGDYLRKSREYRTVVRNGKEEKVKHWYYENNNLEATGDQTENGLYQGYWEFFAKDGYMTACGSFNAAGEKEGKWTWYHFNGKLSEETNFVNGKKEGVTVLFHENGVVSARISYKNDKLDGIREEFYATGVRSSELNWKEGKRDGKGVLYYESGARHYEVNYVNDELEGELKEYYMNGKLLLVRYFKGGSKSGNAESWWENGQKKSEGSYTDDLESGTWVYYFDNGKKKESVSYNESGKLNGLWLSWYYDGQPKDSGTYANGKLTGLHKEYNKKGKLTGVYEFRNDDIVSFICYDGNGKEVGKGERSGRKFVAAYKYPNGVNKATGEYVSGEKSGMWVYYDRFGNVSARENFKEGQLHGELINYHPYGKVENEVNYTMGVRDGYYRAYYSNGNIKTEGWMVNGEQEGEWWYYHSNGTPQSTEFFHAGEIRGTTISYSVTGHPEREFRYYLGYVDRITNYDSTGKILSVVDLPLGTGTYTTTSPDGKILLEIPRKNGMRHGSARWMFPDGKTLMTGAYVDNKEEGEFRGYHENGTLSSVRNFSNGEYHGSCVWYYENGKKRVEGEYRNGEYHGTKKFYYENGKLEREGFYQFDKAEGLFSYYAYDGTLYSQRLYEDDQLVSYCVLDISGKMGPMMNYDGASGTITAILGGGGKVFEQQMKYGDLHGKRVWYYPNGGVYQEQNWEEGFQEGASKTFYPNGQLMEEENYYLSDLHGMCKYYHENGKLKEEGRYILGERVGEWKEYDKTGKLIALKYYASGDLITVKKV
ncbi:MAG: hypothetical protein IT233_12070 [Bacteroidia bacterium]|nr:hypothetical protein [Bacteroidia bacterium]